jgi:hypothetical protein
LEDSYIRANYGEINELCKLNGIPFNATGEKIQSEGLWCVYEFGQQLDAMMFWHRFRGRWLRGEEFFFPERPDNMPAMIEPERRDSFATKPPDLRRATQCRSNPVSGRSLLETGIFQISAGDYRGFQSRGGRSQSLETDRQFAKPRHWRPFLALPRLRSPVAGLPG